MSRITIGITTYNGASRLNELLRSIELRPPEGLGTNVNIVVVDDGSPRVHETRSIVNSWQSKLPITYVEHGINRGIAAGWNTATLTLDNDYTILINDDVIMPSGNWLKSLIYPLENSPLVGGVGMNWHAFVDADVKKLLESSDSDSLVIPRDPGSKAQTPDRRNFEACNPGRVMCPTGQLFAFRKMDYNVVGGFDEQYKSFFEESDFFTSIAKIGKIGLQINWPMCWHRWSATFGANPELMPSERMRASRQHYIDKWKIPPEFRADRPGPFDFTNPKYLGSIPDVEVKFVKKDGSIGFGILRTSGEFING